jgi:hypothetical protein
MATILREQNALLKTKSFVKSKNISQDTEDI